MSRRRDEFRRARSAETRTVAFNRCSATCIINEPSTRRGRAMITDAAAHAACVPSSATLREVSMDWAAWIFRRRVRGVTNTTGSSATAKSTARPSCSVGVLHDISREKICWRLLITQPLLRNWPRKLLNTAKWHKITAIGHYAVQGHSRSPIESP